MPMVRVFIADNQRMPSPPAWFLQRLYDYDSQLVIMPSRYKPATYVLARKCRLGRQGLTGNVIVESITQPDTKMCMQYGCMPVCLLIQYGPQWNADTVLNKLKARDLWAAGGADKAADMLEAQEAKEIEDRRAAKREELMALGRDAYKSYKMRTGQRIVSGGSAHHSRPGAANPKSSSSSTAATGILLTDSIG